MRSLAALVVVRTKRMRTFIGLVERHPVAYLCTCVAAGSVLRLAMVGAQHFWDPRYPLVQLLGGLQ